MDSYQALYAYARDTWGMEYPATISDFHGYRKTTKKSRRIFGDRIASAMGTPEYAEYQRLYVALCHDVSDETVRIFNSHYGASQSGPERNAVNESLIRTLFRLGDAILALRSGQWSELRSRNARSLKLEKRVASEANCSNAR